LGAKKTKEAHQRYLRALGANLHRIIISKGYVSPYDFWIQKAGDEMSRASLNYIIAGARDPRASTLRTLAKLLKVHPKTLLEFD
jgi:hypothetical protein